MLAYKSIFPGFMDLPSKKNKINHSLCTSDLLGGIQHSAIEIVLSVQTFQLARWNSLLSLLSLHSVLEVFPTTLRQSVEDGSMGKERGESSVVLAEVLAVASASGTH